MMQYYMTNLLPVVMRHISVTSISQFTTLLLLLMTMSILLQHSSDAMSTMNKRTIPPQKVVSPSSSRRQLTPPFPSGLCGGTILDIGPEETFGVAVNLANINSSGDMMLLPRTIKIWLPPGYNDNNCENEVRHPVLYVHDGQNAFQDEDSWTGASWRLMGALTRMPEYKLIDDELPIVVLLPSADGDWLPGVRRRHLEYGDMNFPFAQAHADFVANTVKPLVDSRFRTDSSPNRNFAIGSSLGGQASLHLLLRHPDKFGGAACLSPAFGPATLDYVASSKGQEILRNGQKKLYFDIGGDMPSLPSSSWSSPLGPKSKGANDNENFVRVSLINILDGWNPGYFWRTLVCDWRSINSFIALLFSTLFERLTHSNLFLFHYHVVDTQLQGQVTAMRRALDRGGIHYQFRKFPGGRHNERAWALRIDKPLLHLFSNSNVKKASNR